MSQFISIAPLIFFAAVGGGISDVLGRKLLLFWPVFGSLVLNLMGIVEDIFLETIPLKFFYVENIVSFFGGSAVFYLARSLKTFNLMIQRIKLSSKMREYVV